MQTHRSIQAFRNELRNISSSHRGIVTGSISVCHGGQQGHDLAVSVHPVHLHLATQLLPLCYEIQHANELATTCSN
jgi:hypothetical protein